MVRLVKHFVRFYSPGTLMSEVTVRPIDSWDIDAAVAMVKTIVERHNAVPYAFQFSTRGREDNELDSKEVASSPKYYSGGTIKTLAEIEDRNDPSDRVLIDNMRCNGWNKVIVNTNSWRITVPFEDGDILLLPFDTLPQEASRGQDQA